MRDGKLIIGLFVAGMAYAVVRYIVFKGVAWEQLPIFVTNKAVGVTSVALFGVSRLVTENRRRKHLGLVSAMFAALHIMLSMVVLRPSYLDSAFLATGLMHWRAEVSMLTGSCAATLLLWLAYATLMRPIETQTPRASLVPGLGRFVLGLVALHVLFLGYGGWFDLASWPGGLPPITLISFAIALGLCVTPKAKRAKPGAATPSDPP